MEVIASNTKIIKNMELEIEDDISATASELTVSSSYDSCSGCSTPTASHKDKRSIPIFDDLKTTAPKATYDLNFDDVTVEKCNHLLKLSDSPQFGNKTFNHLSNDQKALMLFMIAKKIDNLFHPRHQAAKMIVRVLRPESSEIRRMMSFVHRGRDRRLHCDAEKNQFLETSYSNFVQGRKA
ncbi:unnamed protein product [Cylindrotheca closterium]|uniref:Uncharacterized protein n=1 Tax=Cylindrotheca closterium TaxID=2856 RepID=A0AAD2CT32_9STRA|nr:unnamed protein product [Cylindrotheca closterium]